MIHLIYALLCVIVLMLWVIIGHLEKINKNTYKDEKDR